MERVIFLATFSARFFCGFLNILSSSVAGSLLSKRELGASLTGLGHIEHNIFLKVRYPASSTAFTVGCLIGS